MVSTFTPNKRIEQPAHNDYIDSWDVPVNADWAIIDKAFGGLTSINATGLTGNRTLTTAEYTPLKIVVSGTPTGNMNLVVPTLVGGLWVVRNNMTGSFTLSISSAAGGSAVNVPASTSTLVTCDGTATGMALAITTTPDVAPGANTQVIYNNNGLPGASANLTFNGTTLAATGLSTTGSTVLGNSSGDTLTIGGTAVTAANGLNFNTNQFVLLTGVGEQVAIGTATVNSEKLTVAGSIRSSAGGYVFPDNSIQTTAFVATGVVIDFIGTILPPGWVWANGTTIGNAASNATGRAHATDTLALFSLIWSSWSNTAAPIFNSNGTSGTRGSSAANDFTANKAIKVPDLRGRVVAGMDAFGGSAAAGLLTNTSMAPNGSTMGAIGGTQTHTLTDDQMPAHSHPITDPMHTHLASGLGMVGNNLANGTARAVGTGDGINSGLFQQVDVTVQDSSTGISVDASGGDDPHPNVQPTMVMTKVIKL